MKQKHLIIIPIVTLSSLVSCSNKTLFKSNPGIWCTVSFDSKGGSPAPNPQLIEPGKTASKPTEEPIKDGFTFGGWYTDKEATEYKYDFSRPVITNLTLYARWDDKQLATITFDATEGEKFADTSRYISFSVPVGSKLHPYIDIMKEFEPISSDKVFGYYSYEDSNTVIDYEDVVNNNITLKANYFPSNEVPYKNLDSFDWNFIKQVAVTKKDISKVFKIGATKTVKLYNKNHTVRTIGYNHDNLSNKTTTAGITFEFANLITKEDGTPYKTYWDENETNVFINSTFYTLVNSVFSDLPKGLRDVTQSVEKYVGVGFGKDTTPVRDSTPYDTKLFPLAHDEITKPIYDDQPEGEGSLYDYYKLHEGDATYRVKACVEKSASEDYWLRSPHCSWYLYYPSAWMVFGSGLLSNQSVCADGTSVEICFAPAFCI